MSNLSVSALRNAFGPQFGEIAWYDLNYNDPRIADMVSSQLEDIELAISRYCSEITNTKAGLAEILRSLFSLNFPAAIERPLRILEVGAYRHYSMHLLSQSGKFETVAADISASSLRTGAKLASEVGVDEFGALVSCDFHDLPFSDNYFDLVYIASSVHHTWRTELVLDELLRVAAPNGIILLANEPVKRELCFYQFRTNRQEYFCDWEKILHDTGLMFTISSPVIGSRPEDVFGMIENDRIPWQVFKDFSDKTELLELVLHPVKGEFENQIIEQELTAVEVSENIKKRLVHIRQQKSRVADGLGFTIPDDRSIDQLTKKVSSLLEKCILAEKEEKALLEAQLFGAAMRMVVRKKGHGAASRKLFRRNLPLMDGVYSETHRFPGFDVEIDGIELPAVCPDNESELKKIFPQVSWSIGSDSITLKGDEGKIYLPACKSDGLVLLRFFAHASSDHTYKITVFVNGEPKESTDVVISETKIMHILVPKNEVSLDIKIGVYDDFSLSNFHNMVSIAACRRVPVSRRL